MGTTRQKSSCRNGLQNGPRLLSRVKAGTHSPSPTGSHTAAYTPKQGPSGQGRYHYPRRIPHVHEHPRAGCQNGKLCRFWILAGGTLPKNAESLRSSDALMRVAAPRRRGPAGLRDPIAVSLTALIGFTVLVDRDYRVRKKAHFVLCTELLCQLCLRLPPLCCTL